MKKLFSCGVHFLLLATMSCALLSISSCTRPNETDSATGDVQVQIPVRENGEPQLKVVTLQKMEDLKRVSGGYATFYFAPKIEGTLVTGEVPHARFVKSGDIFVPTDSQSAEMAAVYYHMQSLVQFDATLGLADLNAGVRKVAISTKILKGEDWIKNNSFYDQGSDATIFVDFDSQALPLTLNSGVIAHEHFHSLFSKLVLIPLIKVGVISETLKVSSHNPRAFAELLGAPQLSLEFKADNNADLRRDFQDFVMFKSLNEGLADYWGWVYSKDEKFVSVSIPSEKNRSLQDPSYGFPSSEQRQQQIDSLFEAYISSQDKERALETIQDVGARYAYSLGNQYARFFRSLTTTAEGRNLEAPLQVEFVKKIVSLLNDIRESMLKNKSRDAIQPENIIENFRNKNPEIFKNNCSQFQSVTKKDLSCAGRDQ